MNKRIKHFTEWERCWGKINPGAHLTAHLHIITVEETEAAAPREVMKLNGRTGVQVSHSCSDPVLLRISSRASPTTLLQESPWVSVSASSRWITSSLTRVQLSPALLQTKSINIDWVPTMSTARWERAKAGSTEQRSCVQLIYLIDGQSDTQVTSTASSKKAADVCSLPARKDKGVGEGLYWLQRKPLSPSGKRERKMLCK